MISLVTTHGCKFHCPYCPIPAYNQFTFRFKSPERLRDEIEGDRRRAPASTPSSAPTTTSSTTARRSRRPSPSWPRASATASRSATAVFFGTEATEFDVYKNQDLLPLCREGGLRAIWFGIEDMTAELVKKGQSPEKTQARCSSS